MCNLLKRCIRKVNHAMRKILQLILLTPVFSFSQFKDSIAVYRLEVSFVGYKTKHIPLKTAGPLQKFCYEDQSQKIRKRQLYHFSDQYSRRSDPDK